MTQIVSTGSLTLMDLNDGVNAYLSNEGMTLPADSTGVVTSYTGCSSTMFIYLGLTDDSPNWTVTATPSTGVVGSFGTGAALRTYTVSSLTVNSAYVDFSATKQGFPSTITKRFSLAIAQAGQPGQPGKDGGSSPGAAGDSAVIAYCASATATTNTAPGATTGKTSVPAVNSGGITGTWYSVPPGLTAGQFLYVSNGIYSATTDQITWSVPYWSSLKVGNLNSVSVYTGALTVSDTISSANGNFTVDANGNATMRSVTIKDAGGNTILSSGTKLNPLYAADGTLNSQAIFSPVKVWEFRNTLDGWWTGGGTSTLSIGADAVTVTSTGSDPILRSPGNILINGGTYDKVRARVMRTSGSTWDGTLFYDKPVSVGEGVLLSKQITDTTVTGKWVVLEWDMSGISDWTSNTIEHIRLDMGASSNDIFNVDWVCIGKYGPTSLSEQGYTGDLNASSDLVLIGTSGMQIQGNSATKITGTSWAESVHNTEGYTGGAFVSGRVWVGAVMLGLNTSSDLNDPGYATLDYSIYCDSNNALSMFSAGTSIGLIGTWTAGDTVGLTYDGSNIVWYQNGVVKGSTPAPANQQYFLDTSFRENGSKLTNLRFGPMSSNYWDSIGGRPKDFRVATKGNSATTGPVDSTTAGFYVRGSLFYNNPGRSYNIVILNRSDASIANHGSFDVYAGGTAASDMANFLNQYGPTYIAVVYSYDEPLAHHMDSGLDAAMYRCGASRAVYGSSQFMGRAAYILVGICGCGEGNGNEAYQGAVVNDVNAWCDVAFSVLNGNIIGVSGTYTPPSLSQTAGGILSGPVGLSTGGAIQVGTANWVQGSNATGTGVVISPAGIAGMNNNTPTFYITSSGNANFGGTLMAGTVATGSLSTLNATIGTLRTATSGARTEISDNVIKVFDPSNVLRVKIGNLAL